ncbi:hypothetical protein [Paractinoplanes durhamensis]|uniref:Uncharacterized protein n=1 Tax=Paractinoplanes durhamensis TaxID=113563 RepID=A0ABQ3YPT6_9ACTN|nr:hypothetical protein [Actinoplanes durhamensis]GID99368.1 hypothetical protein Adu01nite_07190 [Actinoplanes durhamensis]
MGKNSKRSAVVAGVVAVLIGGGAAAWAFTGWNVGGTGTADATAASIKALTGTADLGGTLYPGRSVNATAAVTNPNDFPVVLNNGIVTTSVKASGGNSKTGLADCNTALANSDISASFSNTPSLGVSPSPQNVGLAVTVNELPQVCAGLHIQVSFTFSGVQTA